jgi:invasion protein IalB
MRNSLRWMLVIVILPMVQTVAAVAQTPASTPVPKLISSHRDWTVYEITDSRGRVCYLASEPVKQTGNYSKRDNPAVLVVRLPGKSQSEYVSVHPGYPYKKASTVDLKIGGRGFDLFTDGEQAFSRDSDDEKVINAMKSGATMTVRGTSTRGTFSLDTYSLNGISAAYEAMLAACPK